MCQFSLPCDLMRFMMCLMPPSISTLVGESVIVTHVSRVCSIVFMGFKTRSDFVILDMTGFDMILYMTWLSLIILCLMVMLSV